MPTVNEVMPGYQAQSSAGSVAKNELGKDDFLKLFITRLRYQNPLEPINDEQFIAQMAQFSSLEQMQNMNSSLTKLLVNQSLGQEALLQLLTFQGQTLQLHGLNQAVALLGKEVKVSDGDGSLTGVVEKVLTVQGLPVLVIDGKQYSLGQVLEVSNQVVDA